MSARLSAPPTTLNPAGLGQWLRSFLFTSYMFTVTPLYAVVIALFFWLPYGLRYKFAIGWARNILCALKLLCRLDYRVSGLENLPSDNHISMWKHSSSWETVAQMAIFPPQAWVLKRELLWIPIVGWAIKLMRPIAINRSSGQAAVRQVIAQGKQRLANGMWILVFPEGTRVAAGAEKKYGISGALLATETGRLVIPVAHNAGDFWPRRGLLKKPGIVQVVVGPPIDPAGLQPRELNERVRQWIDATLQNLRTS